MMVVVVSKDSELARPGDLNPLPLTPFPHHPVEGGGGGEVEERVEMRSR